MIIAGASAYSKVLDFKKFREAADSCGAYLMVDMAHIAGLVACGLHPNPFPYADFSNVLDKVSLITPVPGGVCPMTVTMLLKNVVNRYKKRHHSE